MSDINMPKLSDTMEEGTIVEWKKKSGDVVKTGDVLAEVESDKATFDLEAESDGVLSILVEQGVPAKIGAQRRGMVGTGSRSEKIRTYNFKENRVTDHRIKLTLHRLDSVMNGDLDELVTALVNAERAALLDGPPPD